MNLRHLIIPAALALAACGGSKNGSGSSSGGSTSSSTSTTSTGSSGSSSSSSGSSGSSSSSSTSSGSSSSGSSGSGSSSGSSGTTGQGAPVITGVSVEGAAQAQIRQGAQGIVHLTGLNLQNASSVQLGTTPLTITSDTATEIVVTVSVNHGAATGPQDVAVTTPGGSTTDTGALSITELTVAPSGSDSAAGVPSSPFATLTHAFSVAGQGDTILLMPGTYGSGETFPSAGLPGAYTCNAPTGVIVDGATDGGSNPLLSAGADGGNAVPLVPCGDLDVTNLDLQGWSYGLVATHTGAVKLGNVHQSGASNDGLYASGSGVVVSISSPTGFNLRTSFEANGASGVHLLSQATLIANKLDARQNTLDGILASDAQSCSLQFTKLDSNGAAGLLASGGTALALGPTVEALYNQSGIVLTNLTRSASLTGILSEANTGDGLAVLGTSKGLTLQDQFIDSNAVGLHVDTLPDAGTQVVVQNQSGNVAGLVANGRGLLVEGAPQSVVLNALNTGAVTIQNNVVNIEVSADPATLVSVRGAIMNGGDGGAAYPDAYPSGGERIPWIVDGGAADGGDLVYIDSSGITQLPLEWDPDAGQGPYNYLLHPTGAQIQF